MQKLLATWLIVLISLPILLQNCAQIAQPPGGKKDTLAPVLVSSNPKNKERNVKTQQIELFFNEYIQADNIAQKTIITPGTGITFTTKARPTSLLLKLNEPLQPNTTYTISFTDAIRDATEKNPAANLKLVFSTGHTLDSLNIGGRITDVQSGKVAKEAFVGLYAPRDTLNAATVKPLYYSRTDTSGDFRIENVKAGEYDVIAFTDNNKNFLFNQQNEKVGFFPSRIKLTSSVDTINIGLFESNRTPVKVARTESRGEVYTLNLSKGIERFSAKFPNLTDSVPAMQASATQLRFFRNTATLDTTTVLLSVTDSLGLRSDIKQKLTFRDRSKREKAEDFTVTFTPSSNEAVEAAFIWNAQFNKPVVVKDASLITILADSSQKSKLDLNKLIWSNGMTNFSYKIETKAKQRIDITIPKEAFRSVLDDTLTTSKVSYRLLDPENFSLIQGRIRTKEKFFFVELVNSQGIVTDRILNQATYVFKNIKPGIYNVRLIIDKNGNGRWDSGQYEFKKLAEPIIYLPTSVNARQNFEFDADDISY